MFFFEQSEFRRDGSAAWRNEAMAGAASLLFLTCWSAVASAQDFPSKPIHFVTIFVAGSAGDFTSRVLGESLAALEGQPVIVENVAGAGGALASERVSHAAPDGHTLLLTIAGTHVMRGFLTRNVPFDPINDFSPVTTLSESATYLVTNVSVPANSMKELIEYAKANPGKIAYGSSGIGSPTHLVGEMIKQLTGAQILHVPYKAVAQTIQDTMTGQLQMSFVIGGGIRPALRSGKIRVLAVTTDRKDPSFPELPSLSEVIPGYETVPNWTGMFAPRGMAPALLQRVYSDVVKALQMPKIKARLMEGGSFVTTDASPDAFLAKIKYQIALAGRIVKSLGIEPSD